MLWTDKDGKAHFTVPEHGFIDGATGAHVVLKVGDRILLGEVVGQRIDPYGDLRLDVKYFNGEPWPLDPLANAVTVLIRRD